MDENTVPAVEAPVEEVAETTPAPEVATPATDEAESVEDEAVEPEQA